MLAKYVIGLGPKDINYNYNYNIVCNCKFVSLWDLVQIVKLVLGWHEMKLQSILEEEDDRQNGSQSR